MDGEPRGAVTFLFSDIEGSTRLWETHGHAMEAVLAKHDALARDAVGSAGGSIFKHTGDGFVASFPSPNAAIRSAITMQRGFETTDWNPIAQLRSRIGIHSGVAQHRDGDFFGRSVNRCARLMSVASGGQIVLSGAAQALLDDATGDDWTIVPLGHHKLKDLARAEEVFQVNADGLLNNYPKLKTVDTFPMVMPRLHGRLVGRTALLADVRRRIHAERLVSLVGPSGVGKSRVAIEAALEAVAGFADGAWYCSVKGLTTAEEMAAVVADVLRFDIANSDQSISALTTALAERCALVVLDGCEAGPDAACDLIEDLLDGCPRVRIIATSRERLRLRTGQVVVDPLALAPEMNPTLDEVRDCRAVELFVDRATVADPDFEVTNTNYLALAEITRRLDGLPLALELAAAQAATLDPSDILRRIERHVGLKPRGENVTVEEAVAWAYDSLSHQHKALFARLALFDGGFDLASAEEVCSDDDVPREDIAVLVADLVDHSLIGTRRDGGSIRFWMLSLLRQFGRARLDKFEPDHRTRDAHFNWAVKLSTEASIGLRGRDEDRWVAAIDTEFANVRAAFRYACSAGKFLDAGELACATYPFAFGRTRYEIAEWAEAAIEGLGADLGPNGPRLLAIVGWGMAVRGDVPASMHLGDEAVALSRQNGNPLYLPHRVRIVAAILSADTAGAGAFAAEARAAIEASGDTVAAVELMGFEAFALAHTDQMPEALAVLDDALAQARIIGNPSLLAWLLYEVGVVNSLDDIGAAETALDHAFELAELVGNRYIGGLILMIRTHISLRSTDAVSSLTAFGDVIEHWFRVANWTNLGNTLQLFANYLATNEHDASAAVILGGVAQSSSQAKLSRHHIDATELLEARDTERNLGTHMARGSAMDMRGLVEFCQSEIVRLSDAVSV